MKSKCDSVMNTEVMDIYSKVGSKIVYAFPKNGSTYNKELAKKYLKLNNVYTISSIRVYDFETIVYLEGVKCGGFTSVLFANSVLPESEGLWICDCQMCGKSLSCLSGKPHSKRGKDVESPYCYIPIPADKPECEKAKVCGDCGGKKYLVRRVGGSDTERIPCTSCSPKSTVSLEAQIGEILERLIERVEECTHNVYSHTKCLCNKEQAVAEIVALVGRK